MDLGFMGLSGFRSVKWESHMLYWVRAPVDLWEWNFSPLHLVDSVCRTLDLPKLEFDIFDLLDWVIGIFYQLFWASEVCYGMDNAQIMRFPCFSRSVLLSWVGCSIGRCFDGWWLLLSLLEHSICSFNSEVFFVFY